MSEIINLLVGAVALEHIGFMIIEIFFWRTPWGMKIFGTTSESAKTSAVLAANQGLYNGFLAAGLIWSLVSPAHGTAVRIFFLGCVILAGLFGGFTAKPGIALVQAFPAALALALALTL